MTQDIRPLFDYLAGLETAVAQIADTWRPDDAAYRADMYRQTMTSLSYAYFAYFHADAEHPDWAPLWNPVYTLQPNPDDIYLYSPLRGDLTYRVSGNRGTCKILSFTTQQVMSGMADLSMQGGGYGHNEVDDTDLGLKLGEEFEVIFSAKRPAGHTGRWAPIDARAGGMMVRFRSYDWANETDPVLSIECLSPVPPKPRLTPDQILTRIQEMAKFPGRKTKLYFPMQNGVKERVGFNVFEPVKYAGALQKQVYWPACFQLEEDEALIIETAMPERRP